MNDITITLPEALATRLLKHGTDFNERLKNLDTLVNEYLLPAAIASVVPTKAEAVLTTIKHTIEQSRRNNNGAVDPQNKIAQIKAFREVVGHSMFPESLRRVLRTHDYLSHGCQQPGLAEGKRFVEDNWIQFQKELS